jgi:hypothetical protein
VALDQQVLDKVWVAFEAGDVERCPAHRVLAVDVSTGDLDELRHDLEIPTHRGPVQRGEPFSVGQLDVGPSLEQTPEQGLVAHDNGVVDWREQRDVVLLVHVRATINQETSNGLVLLLDGDVEGQLAY